MINTRKVKSILATLLAGTLAVDSLHALPLGASSAPTFGISIPASLGSVTDTYKARSTDTQPELILIQDLHSNRSVQFSISGILRSLKSQNLLPEQVAVEGGTGPIDLTVLGSVQDPKARKKGADYLVRQGEIPGDVHFALLDGQTKLYGVEDDASYQAMLNVYRESYKERMAVREQLDSLLRSLAALESNDEVSDKVAELKTEVQAVRGFVTNDVIPNELPEHLRNATAAAAALQGTLINGKPLQLTQPLNAAVNFYALALMRDKDLFNNTVALRQAANQKTSVLLAGGFHSEGIAELCRKNGLSYAVVTPTIKRHTRVDEALYVRSMLGNHITVAQLREGIDWAARMIRPPLQNMQAEALPNASASQIGFGRNLGISLRTLGDRIQGLVRGIATTVALVAPATRVAPAATSDSTANPVVAEATTEEPQAAGSVTTSGIVTKGSVLGAVALLMGASSVGWSQPTAAAAQVFSFSPLVYVAATAIGLIALGVLIGGPYLSANVRALTNAILEKARAEADETTSVRQAVNAIRNSPERLQVIYDQVLAASPSLGTDPTLQRRTREEITQMAARAALARSA